MGLREAITVTLALLSLSVAGCGSGPFASATPSSASTATPVPPTATPSVAAALAPVEPGTWSVVAQPTVVRGNETATPLLDGRVLVGGGDDQAGSGLAGAEVYNPSTNTWSPTGPMHTLRHLHTATLLQDGRVLVAAGSTGPGGILASAEIYDPRINSWSVAASLLTARAYASSVRLPDGRVLVVGGLSRGPTQVLLASAELYDPRTDSWSSAGLMTGERSAATLTVLTTGKVLVVGVSAPELYDPASNRWSPAGTMVVQGSPPNGSLFRFDQAATLLPSGRVLVTGGTFGGEPERTAEIYDPSSNSWSAAASMTVGRLFPTTALLADGRVLAVGGSDASAELYDPTANTWTMTASAATAWSNHAATLNIGKVLVLGCATAAGPYAELYTPG